MHEQSSGLRSRQAAQHGSEDARRDLPVHGNRRCAQPHERCRERRRRARQAPPGAAEVPRGHRGTDPPDCREAARSRQRGRERARCAASSAFVARHGARRCTANPTGAFLGALPCPCAGALRAGPPPGSPPCAFVVSSGNPPACAFVACSGSCTSGASSASVGALGTPGSGSSPGQRGPDPAAPCASGATPRCA